MSGYQIIDEPKPGGLARFIVNPMWPLLGGMLGGFLVGWLWFLLNTLALNSRNRNKELVTIALAFVSFFFVYRIGVPLYEQGALGHFNPRYFYLFCIVVQLIFSYVLFTLQEDSFELYRYFGGHVATPAIGLLVAMVAGSKLQMLALNLIWGGM